LRFVFSFDVFAGRILIVFLTLVLMYSVLTCGVAVIQIIIYYVYFFIQLCMTEVQQESRLERKEDIVSIVAETSGSDANVWTKPANVTEEKSR